MPMRPLMRGEQKAFPEELGEDAALGGADGFHDADFAGALGDRDEHDVDDAHGAEGEGDDADAAEKDIHGVEDGADHVALPRWCRTRQRRL